MDRIKVTRTDLWVAAIRADGTEGAREPVRFGLLDAHGVVAFAAPLFGGLREMRVPTSDVLLDANGRPGPLLHRLVEIVRINNALRRETRELTFADVRPLEEQVAAYLAAAHEAWA